MSNYLPPVAGVGYNYNAPGQIAPAYRDHTAFHGYVMSLAKTFAERSAGRPLFIPTSVPGESPLFAAYLAAFPNAATAQYHNCACCKRFLETYGGLITVDDKGVQRSALWNPSRAIPGYGPVIEALKRVSEDARDLVPAVFSEEVWGQPSSPLYGMHLHVTPPAEKVFKSKIRTAHQEQARIKENIRNVNAFLYKFTHKNFEDALTILASGKVNRDDALVAPMKWLAKLKRIQAGPLTSKNLNLVLKEITVAPDGFCHPASSMAGTFLEMISTGHTAERILASINSKTDPLKYQRPVAAPAKQTIERAAETVEKLGLTSAFRRRLATVEDIETFWTPQGRTSKKQDSGKNLGIFSEVQAKPTASTSPAPSYSSKVRLPEEKAMTWSKFQSKVLPNAVSIKAYVTKALSPHLTQFTTAEDPKAGRLLRWDTQEKRNHVSSYCYPKGISLSNWTVSSSPSVALLPVWGIAHHPEVWNKSLKDFGHESQSVTLMLAGIADKAYALIGLTLFPENLRSELHDLRDVIEKYSKSGSITPPPRGYSSIAPQIAAGLTFRKTWGVTLEVETETSVQKITIDRAD